MTSRLGLLASLSLFACNSPPAGLEIEIQPDPALSGDDLELAITSEPVDPDGDTVSLLISWFRDGTEVEERFGERTVPAASTARGESWSVRVIPSDGKVFGAEATDEAAIVNGRPVVTAVELTPSSVRTNGTLEAVYIADDPDDDLIEDVTYRWLVNGVALTTGGKTLGGFTGFDKDESVVVEVTVSDGTDLSEPAASDPVVVDNTPPTAPEISISPAEPSEDDDLVCGIALAATDEDGDALEYTFTWDVDGRFAEGHGHTDHDGDTVLASQTDADEFWTCTVTASDGDDETRPVSSEPVEVSGGVVPGFVGELGPRLGGGWLQCAGYRDRASIEDIPDRWADLCAGAAYSQVRLVCGQSVASYRYIEVEKNVFRLGLSGYPESGLISDFRDQNGNTYSTGSNLIYAEDSNNPSSGRSWWVGGSGCSESAETLTVNNLCAWEASNCFGQNLSGDRYLWAYAAP